jgi:hypothetical protein
MAVHGRAQGGDGDRDGNPRGWGRQVNALRWLGLVLSIALLGCGSPASGPETEQLTRPAQDAAAAPDARPDPQNDSGGGVGDARADSGSDGGAPDEAEPGESSADAGAPFPVFGSGSTVAGELCGTGGGGGAIPLNDAGCTDWPNPESEQQTCVTEHTTWATWDMLGRCTYWCPQGQTDCDDLPGWTCEVAPGSDDGGQWAGYCVPAEP